MTDPLSFAASLPDSQRAVFALEFSRRAKSPTVGVLLAVFLGGLGVHRFYLGQTGLGLLYLLFSWTLIPACVALVEAFLMPGRVDRYNADVARTLADTLAA